MSNTSRSFCHWFKMDNGNYRILLDGYHLFYKHFVSEVLSFEAVQDDFGNLVIIGNYYNY